MDKVISKKEALNAIENANLKGSQSYVILTNYINQAPVLDKDIEEALYTLEEYFNVFMPKFNDNEDWLHKHTKALNTIKQSLQSRPITSDEICEATSCIGHKVTYDKNRKLFSSKYHLVAQLTVDGLRIGFHFKPEIAHKITTFFMENKDV